MRVGLKNSQSSRLLVLVLAAASLGACSDDAARFSSDPFANPFAASSSRVARASTPAPQQNVARVITGAQAIDDPVTTAAITSRNLDTVQTGGRSDVFDQPLPKARVSQPEISVPRVSSVQGVTSPSARNVTGRGVASSNYPTLVSGINPASAPAKLSYSAPASPVVQPSSIAQPSFIAQQGARDTLPISLKPAPDLQAMQALAPGAATGGGIAGWTAVGGSTIQMKAGESVESVAAHYGVPANALRAVNGLSGKAQPSAGQSLLIPTYNPVNRVAAPVQAGAKVASATASQPRQSLLPPKNVGLEPSQAQAHMANQAHVTSDAEKRAAAKLAQLKQAEMLKTAKLSEADKTKAASKTVLAKAESAKTSATRQVADKTAPVKNAATKIERDVRSTASIPGASLPAKSVPSVASTGNAASIEAVATDNVDSSGFRWPVKGRVISGFGTKGPSGNNEGINIALPEGTPVRAVEDGTVVHADDALKGYGKMVLVRHANGYVSVYAHNGELNVKRGDTVKRGQTLAKSGATGNVTSPQLHFELRKGATPVDPTKYLAAN